MNAQTRYNFCILNFFGFFFFFFENFTKLFTNLESERILIKKKKKKNPDFMTDPITGEIEEREKTEKKSAN